MIITPGNLPDYNLLQPYFVAEMNKFFLKIPNATGVITSAYRTPEHNEQVGGAKNSRHMSGEAIDIVFQNVSVFDVLNAMENLRLRIIPNIGRGYYHFQWDSSGPVIYPSLSEESTKDWIYILLGGFVLYRMLF